MVHNPSAKNLRYIFCLTYLLDGDDDDDDNHGADIDHNTVGVVVVPSPEFTMHTAEEAICLCLVIKKNVFVGFNSLSDQHNIW